MIFSRKSSGFTLVELMVAMAISSIVLGIIYATYQAQLKSQVTQQQVVEMQQNARAAIYAMEREIRLAAYDPTESGVPQITSAQIGSITFTMDIHNGIDDDADSAVDEFDERGRPNVDGDVNDNLEQITYRLSNDADNDGIADGDEEQPLALKHPGDAAGSTELAVGQLEDLSNFRSGPVTVVGEHFTEHGHAAGAVTLVDDLFEIAAFEFAGTFLDRPLDIVLWHADGLGVIDGVTQAEIRIGIASAAWYTCALTGVSGAVSALLT